MTPFPKEIRSAYVFTPGDPDVGINGDSASIEADGDFLIDLSELDEQDAEAAIDSFRKSLKTTFSELWGDHAQVIFDFEAG